MNKSITEIFKELNESNSSNYKIKVLKQYSDNELLAKIFKMAYDKVEFSYGVTLKNVDKFNPVQIETSLECALSFLADELSTREVTGNAALQSLSNTLYSLSERDSIIIKKIINRDIRCNVGRTQINKVFPNLITKPIYMRCGVFNDKTKKKIQYPATLQMKCDGTYREFTVQNGEVQARSRSGESYEYPELFEALSACSNGMYFGELTVRGITDRAIGNGMINSKDVPYSDLIFDAWDYVIIEEYKNASNNFQSTLHVQISVLLKRMKFTM